MDINAIEKNKKYALKMRFYALIVTILQSLIKCPEKLNANLNENKIELKYV